MKNFHKNMNIAFMGGLIGAALMTWLAPHVIAALFTAPVSFGINCEPVGHWSMEKLIICQLIGLVIFIPLTFWLKSKIFSKGSDAKTA